MRLPWKLTREWTAVVPEDHAMAMFINGQVTQGDEHEPVNSKRGALYRRRVLILRGRWKLVELNGWDDVAGDWQPYGAPASAGPDDARVDELYAKAATSGVTPVSDPAELSRLSIDALRRKVMGTETGED